MWGRLALRGGGLRAKHGAAGALLSSPSWSRGLSVASATAAARDAAEGPGAAGRAARRRDPAGPRARSAGPPRSQRAPRPAPSPARLPSAPAPSLPPSRLPGGGDAAAARSSRGSLSLTGEPGGGGRHLTRQSLAGPSLRKGKVGTSERTAGS